MTDDKLLYNSRIIDSYIKLIKRRYNYINISELLSYAKMEPYQVEDEGHWFTQEQIDLFHEKLSKLTGNKHISREAGRYAASPEAKGTMRQYILGLVGPAKAYDLVGKFASNFTKSSTFKSEKIGSNMVKITVTPKEGVSEKPFQCENRMGYFEAIALAFNYKMPRIEHSECIFDGGSACSYIVSWKELRSDLWKKIRNYSAVALLLITVFSYYLHPDVTLRTVLPFYAIAVLLLAVYTELLEKKELSAAIDSLRTSSDKLLEHIESNYNNALTINDIGFALSKQRSVDDILSNTVQILEKRLDYDRGMILMADIDKFFLTFRTGFGYNYEQFAILKNTRFHLDRPDSKGAFVLSFREQRPILVNDISEIESSLSSQSLMFARKMGTKSFICSPITYEDESLGILVVDNVKTKRPLLQSDVSLLMGIAPGIGISIYNARLIDAKERQFKSIIQTLAASIDARDFLTAGHSERVTEYALGIAARMGLSKDYCEMIRVAALLHDYGKIGIKDSVLKKNGSLSFDEYEEIKTHAEKTQQILEQVNFEGIYKEVPQIAAFHHEKFDGSGYPRGLKEEEIPLGARIIAVADFFEAITSKRHYRDDMPLDTALSLLKDKKGTYFDPVVVDAFVEYYIENQMPRYLVYQHSKSFLN